VRPKVHTAKEAVKAAGRKSKGGKGKSETAPARSQSLSTGIGAGIVDSMTEIGAGSFAESQVSAPVSMGSIRSMEGLTADQKISVLMDMNADLIKNSGSMTDASGSVGRVSNSAHEILSHYQSQQWAAAGVNSEGSLASSQRSMASLKASVNAPRVVVPAKLGQAKLTLPAMDGKK
jgi:hypothetical protein